MYTMKLQLLTALRLQCTVCRRLMNEDRIQESMTLAALFGAAKYVICSGCMDKVDEETMQDRNYRARWTRKMRAKCNTEKAQEKLNLSTT